MKTSRAEDNQLRAVDYLLRVNPRRYYLTRYDFKDAIHYVITDKKTGLKYTAEEARKDVDDYYQNY